MRKILKYQYPSGSIGTYAIPTLNSIQSSVDAFKKNLDDLQKSLKGYTPGQPSRKSFSDNLATPLGSTIGDKQSSSGGTISDKGGGGFTDFMKKDGVADALGTAPEVIDAGLKLVGAKEATISGAGDAIFNQATTTLWKGALKSGNPYAIAGAGILKGVDSLNRYAGKKTKKQGTDASLDTGGYTFQVSPNAGQKTTLSKRGWAKNINSTTKRADTQNMLAGNAAYEDKRNKLGATNIFGDISTKNTQQLLGGINTNIFSAKKGAKINPKQLSSIKKKALRKVKKNQMGDSIDDQAKLKNGGQLNVIPEGALHARRNNYDGELAEQVTNKGIPVITYEEGGDINQHAEIEVNEIIFTKETTNTLEDYFKKYQENPSDELAIECGKFLSEEILENTDDRTGLLETIK